MLETVVTLVSGFFTIVTGFVSPWLILWTVLVFAAGCWFYRWMLKRDPARLEKLVDQVNGLGAYAESAYKKVKGNPAPKEETKP